MHKRARELSMQSGFSMVEVLISLLILLLGLLGLAGLIVTSQRTESESYQRSQALLLLKDIAARINTNRRVAACYVVTTDTANGAPYLGAGGTLPPACALGTLPANSLANSDLAAWNTLLQGSSESLGGANAGAMVGARGCITFDAPSGTYFVSVAWQGNIPTTAPVSSLTCGKNLYGDETLRRVVSIPVQIANLN